MPSGSLSSLIFWKLWCFTRLFSSRDESNAVEYLCITARMVCSCSLLFFKKYVCEKPQPDAFANDQGIIENLQRPMQLSHDRCAPGTTLMEKRDKDCWKPEKHPRHMCELYKLGMMMEYDQQSQNPIVSCAKCGAKADLAEAVCQPKSIEQS